MEGCKFKIGDVVAKKEDVERWATGEHELLYASEIKIISESTKGFTCTNGRHSGMNVSDVIPKSEIKAYALKYLANRMAIIAEA